MEVAHLECEYGRQNERARFQRLFDDFPAIDVFLVFFHIPPLERLFIKKTLVNPAGGCAEKLFHRIPRHSQ